MNNPRVLILSNECLSKSSSNGRTLRNFLIGWPPEKLAQFYLQPGVPDFELCGNYFCLTDGQALRAFLGKGGENGVVARAPAEDSAEGNSAGASGGNGVGRNALTMLVRELIWNSGRWRKGGFDRWAAEFTPQVILLQAGDCGFMLKLAEELSARYDAPLVTYNSEDYCFKKYDYFRAKVLVHWCYPLFHRQLMHQYRRTLATAYKSIYICEPLQQAYDRVFHRPSETVYTATEMTPRETPPENPVFRASYLGNLGVGRHEVLMELAAVLHDISEELYLDVYGRIPNEAVRQALESCPGIRYRGFVSYGEVVRIMQESDLLIHAESFDSFYREDLKFAFSTKIADSLAVGICFLLYAPEELACAQYLKENDAAWVVSDRAQLKETLRLLVKDPAARSRYLDRAAKLARENHNAGKNAAAFQAILKQAAEKG